ncbi:hypothetical protein HPB48_017490 [Haemaphysalis longicornis]|uniref:Uncharacterized protein n=1 Tax=Haemaphysalis longicornis TaxID=44386 RepID=A0A9J6FGB2_HAELO|nr:hypothetical protein HPB48_017490 [Haemaphysalis longicornis]
MAPPGRKDGRPSTAAATVADTQTGYDPHSMVCTSIPTSDSPPELPQSFKSAALTAAVARREQASTHLGRPPPTLRPWPRLPTRTLTPAATRSQRRAPRARSGGTRGFCGILKPLPKPKATDFVVVLKPRTQLSLANAFPENGAGRALIAHLGATRDTASHCCDADKLIGEFAVPSPAGPVPLFGYLRADTHDSCYGVVTVRSSDTEAALRESLYWPEGEILHVRRLGTSNKVKPRYVSYDAPADPGAAVQENCSSLRSVWLCLDIDPTPVPAPNLTFVASFCGKAVPLTDGARVLCVLVPTVTGDRRCKERYRAPPPQAIHSSIGRSSRPARSEASTPTEAAEGAQPPATNTDPPPRPGAVAIGPSRRGPTPDGPTAKKPNTGQALPPHPNRTSHHLSSNPLPRGIHRSQVSGSGGAAFSPTPYVISQPKPPTPSTPTREQIEFRRLQAQVASLTQTVEALVNRSSSPNSTPLGQAPEAMDSSPSEHRETAANLGPLEERLSNLEAQMASIGTMIENRLAAALQTAFDRIPGKIAAQMSQLTVSTRRPKLKRGSRDEVDEQSNSSTATSEVSTGSSSGAPMQPFALLEAPHTFSSNDGGQRP